MFKKIFKSVAEKLFNAGNKQPIQKVHETQAAANAVPKAGPKKKPIHVSRKEKRGRMTGGYGNGTKGTCYFNGKPDKHLRKQVA